mgnify:CR=1 FL=1
MNGDTREWYALGGWYTPEIADRKHLRHVEIPLDSHLGKALFAVWHRGNPQWMVSSIVNSVLEDFEYKQRDVDGVAQKPVKFKDMKICRLQSGFGSAWGACFEVSFWCDKFVTDDAVVRPSEKIVPTFASQFIDYMRGR